MREILTTAKENIEIVTLYTKGATHAVVGTIRSIDEDGWIVIWSTKYEEGFFHISQFYAVDFLD